MKPKTKIVIASLLKPIDDTRMFEKFGRSLGALPDTEVHIVGFKSNNKKLPDYTNIFFHPLFRFSRIGIRRFLAPLKYYIFLIKVKPEVIIANTHDLLIVTTLYKILFGSKILYDVQENYYLNILHTDAFPVILRPMIAGFVRLKEIISAPLFSHYFLAEEIYSKQLPFTGKKYSIILNKYEPVLPLPNKSSIRIAPEKPLKMVFTGTISSHYGILETIQITNIISKFRKVSLTIIGRCANKTFLDELRAYIADNECVELIAGEHPIGHLDIIEAIKGADLGIISYRANKSTFGRIPTKVYEYMANKLPFLVLHEPEWIDFALKYNACIAVKPDQNYLELVKEIEETTFYPSTIPPQEILWHSEREKLILDFNKLLNKSKK